MQYPNTHGNYRFDSAMLYLSLFEAIALYGLILRIYTNVRYSP